MSGCHGKCFIVLVSANADVCVLLLGNQIDYGEILFCNICNDRDDYDVCKHNLY